MATPPHSSASSGCFAAILRRMLGRDGLPTHPSDDLSGSKPSHYDLHQKQPTTTAPATHGVVARLMGLESLPDTTLNRVTNGPDSVRRSRSVNFMDYLLKFDFADQPPQQFHRRVRSSVSFRQVPVTASPQPNEVFVLYVDNVGEKKKGRSSSKQRKPEVGSKQRKQEQSRHVRARAVVKKEKVSKLKDEPRRVSVRRSDLGFVTPNKKHISRKQAKPPKKLVSRKEALTELESSKKTDHDQCSSVDSSPVSVLDLDLGEFLIHHDGTHLSGEVNADGKMRSTLKFSENEHQFPIPTRIPDVEDRIKKDDAGFSNHETEDLMEVRSKLCRLAEEDVEESNWSSKGDIGDICVELGGRILNQLLEQVVDEIVSSVPF